MNIIQAYDLYTVNISRKVSCLYQVDANARYFNRVLSNQKWKVQKILNM